jgi:glutathione synthase/RimK-type ligase-like ATP-grasp enzyme
MRSLKLSTGSVDMIVNRNQDYIFLEVNPVGQFQFLSQICNFQIEQKIAEFLANPSYE